MRSAARAREAMLASATRVAGVLCGSTLAGILLVAGGAHLAWSLLQPAVVRDPFYPLAVAFAVVIGAAVGIAVGTVTLWRGAERPDGCQAL